MAVLIDTSVLVRAFNPKAHEFSAIRGTWRDLGAAGDSLIVTPQVLAEFWNVCTRPASQNGRGLTVVATARMAAATCRLCSFQFETVQSFEIWRQLVERYQVVGKSVHDARLAAIMIAARIPAILTLNVKDFERYRGEGIVAMSPVGN